MSYFHIVTVVASGGSSYKVICEMGNNHNPLAVLLHYNAEHELADSGIRKPHVVFRKIKFGGNDRGTAGFGVDTPPSCWASYNSS